MSGNRYYLNQNADLIWMMIGHYGIPHDTQPGWILGFQLDRKNRKMRNDDGREWDIPESMVVD